MVTLRNALLLMAVCMLMASAANGQIPQPFSCSPSASGGGTPSVRSEGLTELVGDVLLICTGGDPTPEGEENVPRVNIRVFLNTNITSRLIGDDWNEALLLIDDPEPVDQELCGDPSGCEINGVGGSGVDYSEEPNVYQAQPLPQSNAIEWRGVPIDPPGTGGNRTLRIVNVRANAAALGTGGLIPSQLVMFISITGEISVPVNPASVALGFVQQGMSFSAEDGSFLQCEDPSGEDPIEIEFSELLSSAFKIRNTATTPDDPTDEEDQNLPGVPNFTETGFYHEALTGTAGLTGHGTRLVAQFRNIPDGVQVYVSAVNKVDEDLCSDETDAGCYEDIATIVEEANSVGRGGTPATLASAVSWDPDNDDIPDGFFEVNISGNAGAATWEIVQADPFSNGDVLFDVMIFYEANTEAGIPALGTGDVAGSFGPVSDVGTAISDNDLDLHPRFEDTSEDEGVLVINPCATNLLWPYVTNAAGFDTGMVISNTTMDPFGTTTQEGACVINYYGNSNGGDPPAADTTPTVGAGGFAVWTLSSGGGVVPYGGELEGVINAAPGFSGYVIAQCAFQYAHGYAFISDLGAQKVAQGYLALVLDEAVDSRTDTKSEALNQ